MDLRLFKLVLCRMKRYWWGDPFDKVVEVSKLGVRGFNFSKLCKDFFLEGSFL